MIIPSVDLQSSKAVQLVGGKELAVDAGDPRPIATKFGRIGEIAVIDLDAAMGTGDQTDTIKDLPQAGPVSGWRRYSKRRACTDVARCRRT